MKNKTVILEIENIDASKFSEDRMLKISIDSGTVRPANVNVLIYGEYISAGYDRLEFTLPNDFDGQMNFVFYQAELKDLKITAYYK